MADSEVHVRVNPDTSDLSRVLRVIAKHAVACADELDGGTPEQPETAEQQPQRRAWGRAL